MIAAMVLSLLLWTSLALDGGIAGCPACATFPTPAAAFQEVLRADPLVLAVGEYHERAGDPKVHSALQRFTVQLLPLLKGRLTSLVAETWMITGRCGLVETQAAKAVERTTRRPASTEDELTTLMTRSNALGAKNHTLLLSCSEHRSMIDDAGELDPEASLLLVRGKVAAKALEVREAGEGGVPGKLLVLYGGALHNDLHPLERWAPYAFGPELEREVPGHYVELDLLVPEYVADDEELRAEPWFAPAMQRARLGQTVLIRPAPQVYLLVFPSGPRR